MTTRVVRLPDVGEGVAEAELVSWQVAVGDEVHPDSVLAEVLTDKATVEVYSPVAGRVLALHGTVGDVLAVGSDLVRIDTDVNADTDSQSESDRNGDPAHGGAETPASSEAEPELAPDGALSDEAEEAVADAAERPGVAGTSEEAIADTAAQPGGAGTHGGRPSSPPPRSVRPDEAQGARTGAGPRSPQPMLAANGAARPPHHLGVGQRPIAAPAVRQRARDLGVDLRLVRGTGPAERITHADLDAYVSGSAAPVSQGAPATDRLSADVPIVGLRRRIAERMSTSASRIPHITYVDEVDVGQVDELRRTLNTTYRDHSRLTLLPFLMRAIVAATVDQPHINATFDDEAGVLHTSGPVHIGIATQTPNGLLVPVVRNADTLDLWQSAADVARVSEAARTSKATRDELGGSTITITSLGALGGLVTTPIINHPEVAIVGVNKMQVRPVWDGNNFVPRTMMNLSSSFDHRVVDGWDAATFVQRIKALLETPSLLFIGAPRATP